MSASKIEWTERTWNPVTGCNKVSQGCKNCYAEVMHKRLMSIALKKYSRPFLDGAFPYEPDLMIPLRWKKPCMIFVNSMSDLFHENVPFIFIRKVFEVMAKCQHHTFQILTKRPYQMQKFFQWVHPVHGDNSPGFPLPNVWIGVSVEDQQTANERIKILQQIPAAVRFLSCEPVLEPIDINEAYNSYRQFGPICSSCTGSGHYHDNFNTPCPDCKQTGINDEAIHWVIAGGESGHNARPMHPDWIRSLRDQCKAAAVPFFFKQWGEYMPLEFDAQPPFRYFSNNPKKLIDAHGIDVLDAETSEAGYYNGHRFVDPMESILICEETESEQCDFLKVGKKRAGRVLDGSIHNEYPKIK